MTLEDTLARLSAHLDRSAASLRSWYSTDYSKLPVQIGTVVKVKVPKPCDHHDARFNMVTVELVCICGARKDVHIPDRVWIRDADAIDHREDPA